MPKKFKGENSKAVEARGRKEAAKQEEKERVEKAKEDELWKDDDKHALRKTQRKEGKESKRVEQLERKKELQSLHDDEMAAIKGAKAPPAKVTRAQILEQQERKLAAEAAKENQDLTQNVTLPIENLNRLEANGEEARTVEEAISVMSVQEAKFEKHPEKRVKAAYTAFEEARLPVLKEEYSNFRLSQLKQMLKKEWQKSPDNPLNQRQANYNSKS